MCVVCSTAYSSLYQAPWEEKEPPSHFPPLCNFTGGRTRKTLLLLSSKEKEPHALGFPPTSAYKTEIYKNPPKSDQNMSKSNQASLLSGLQTIPFEGKHQNCPMHSTKARLTCPISRAISFPNKGKGKGERNPFVAVGKERLVFHSSFFTRLKLAPIFPLSLSLLRSNSFSRFSPSLVLPLCNLTYMCQWV